MDQLVDSLETKLLGIVVAMILDPGRPFERYTQITKMVVVVVDAHVHVNVDELERKLGKCCFTHSRTTGIMTTWYCLVGIVYVVGLKKNHRK